MKVMFRVRAGRWSATVRSFKPGSFGDHAITLGVVFNCDRYRIICYGFNATFKELAGKPRGADGPVLACAELFELSLSEQDQKDLRRLVFAVDAVCACVSRGGSANEWCRRQGLRPTRNPSPARGRTRPGQVEIRVGKRAFVLSARRFSRERLVPRRKPERT